MKLRQVFEEIKTNLEQAGFNVRTQLQEVLPRIGVEVFLEVDTVRTDPAETHAYEWSLTVRISYYEDRHGDALDTLQKLMMALDNGTYTDVLTWQIEYGTVNAVGSYYEGEVIFTVRWYAEVST